MKSIILISFLTCILCMNPLGCAQPYAKPVLNLMIDADIPASASKEDIGRTADILDRMYRQLDNRNLTATFFATEDLVRSYGRLRLTYIGQNPHFELAIGGGNLDERLTSKSYSEQKTILQKSKEAIEACKVCGKNEIAAWGFKPQSFDQNEDTYKVLDELGIEYDAGFQAGLIFAPGHQDDVWPYKLEDHDFYAVPVSTYDLSGQIVPLQDRYFNESGLSSAQWYDALEAKFNDAKASDEPMVIILTKSISGSGDYFEAFKKFLDFATSNDATFVTTMDLVNMSREEAFVPPARATKEDEISVGVSINELGATANATSTNGECTTCGKAEINASNTN